MLQNYTDLLPYRGYSEHSVLQMYSFNGTGFGGRFVVAETGNQDPALTVGRYSSTAPGATYAGTTSLRYENPRKVKYAVSGDTKGAVLGLALYGTVEFDANLQRIILEPEIAKELGVVLSGQTTPIATEGYFRLRSGAYTNTPIPGYVGVISDAGAGKIAFVPPSAAVYSSGLAVCKALSTSGSAFGGYVDVQLMLT